MSTFFQNEGSKKKSQNDSDEESSSLKRDEPDRALVMFRPMVSDPIYIHRKSPLPRSKKIGSVEVSGIWISFDVGCFYAARTEQNVWSLKRENTIWSLTCRKIICKIMLFLPKYVVFEVNCLHINAYSIWVYNINKGVQTLN